MLSPRRKLTDIPAPTSVTLTADSHLMEDFIISQNISVDQPGSIATTTVAPYVNPVSNQSEALVIQNGQIYQVAREPLSKTGWTLRGLGAAITSVSAVDSASAWVNFTGTPGYQKISTGYWSAGVATYTDDLTTPTVGSDGSIWALDVSNDCIVTLDVTDPANPQWAPGPPNPPVNADDLHGSPAGTASNLWLLGGGNSDILTGKVEYFVWNYNGTQWNSVAPVIEQYPSDNPPTQVLVGPDGSVWLLMEDESLLSAQPQGWTHVPNLPGPILSVGAAGSGTLWAIVQPRNSDNPALYTLQVTIDGSDLTCSSEEASGPFELVQGGATPQVSCGGVDGTLWLSDSNGTLWKFLPGLSTEWQRQVVPPGLPSTFGGDITEVVVITNSGSPSAFYVQGGQLFMCNFAEGAWQEALVVGNSEGSPIGGCSGLTVAQDDQGLMFVHAATGEGLVVANTPGVPAASVYSSKVPLTGNSVQVSASSDQWIVLVAIANSSDLFVSLGSATNPTKSFEQVKASGMPQSFQSLVPAARSNPYYALAIDAVGDVWFISGLAPQNNKISLTFQQLTGGTTNSLIGQVTAISSTLPAGASPIQVFAVSNQQLWLMRSGEPYYGNNWMTFHPLGDLSTFVGAGVGTIGMMDLWFLDTDSFLNRLWQDPVSGNWIAQPVLQPDIGEAEPTYVSQYVTQLTVENTSPNWPPGAPAAGVPIIVSAVEPVAVWVDGTQYNVDEGQPATLTTDPFGRITFETIALGLHTAQLTFTPPAGTGTALSVYPPLLAHNILAALDSQGKTLNAAQATTQTVPTAVSAPLVSSQNQVNSASASQTITGTIQLQATNGVGPGTVNPPGLSAQARGNEHIRELMRGKIVSTRMVAGPDGSTERLELLGDFWSDLLNFAEDVFHAIENGVIDVVNVVVTDTIEITLSIAKFGQHLVSLAVQTIHDVENAFITAFRWVVVEVEQVINWLKELFDWTDIVNAGKVMAYTVSAFLSSVTSYVTPVGSNPSPLQAYIDGKFTTWKTDINNALTSLAGNNQPLSQYAPGTPTQPPDAYNNGSASSQSRGNFAHRHAQSYVQNGGVLVAPGGDTSQLSGLNSVGSRTQSQNGPALQSFSTNLQGAMQNPSSLINSAVSDLLLILKDVIDAALDAAQWLADEMVKVAAAALAAFQSGLEAALNIPVLTWLFNALTGESLTLLNLFCLIFAFPTTIIYKLFNNNQAPFSSSELETYLNFTFDLPAIGSSSPAGGLRGFAWPVNGYMRWGMLGAFIAFGLVDVILDGMMLNQAPSTGFGTFLSCLSVMLTAITLVLGGPWSALGEDPSTWSAADAYYVVIWSGSWLMLVVNIAFLFLGLSKANAQASGTLGQILTGIGGIVLFLIGLLFLLADLAAEKPEYNGYYYTAELLGPWSFIQKLFFPVVGEEPLVQQVATLVAAIVDIAADVGSGAMDAYEDGLLPLPS